MKVYSSYLCESDQSRANPLLKVTGASNNVCVDYIVLASDLKKDLSLNHSRDSFKNASSSSNETSEVFISESLNHSFRPLFHNIHSKTGALNI